MPNQFKIQKYFSGVFIVVWLCIFIFEFFMPDNFINRFEFDTLIYLTAKSPKVESPIVMIAIDEPSFAELKLQWPWPRSLYARLIQQLQEVGVLVIALDIGFYDNAILSQEDQLFAKAIKEYDRVVLSSYINQIDHPWFSQKRIVYPLKSFIEAGALVGNITVTLDTDGVLRKLPDQDDAFWSIIFNLYRQNHSLLNHENKADKFIRYSDPKHSFRVTSFYQALEPDRFLPPHYFKDSIVIIGYMNKLSTNIQQGKNDTFLTPFSRFTGKSMFGSEIHSHLIHSAITQLHLTRANVIMRSLLFTLTILVSWQMLKRWQLLSNALFVVLVSLLLCCLSVLIFFQGIWLPITFSILGIWVVYFVKWVFAYSNELSMRRYLRKAFSRYVSDNVINLIVSDPNKLDLGGNREEVSFIFTDIADFTPLTESIPASILVDLMNDYFEGMSLIVMSYNGTIERFVGDSLVIFFNAPVKQADHPRLSVQCALEMNDFGLNFAKKQNQKGVSFGKTRIGVNTGMVSVGNFGGKKRFHYTAMGDAINIASRLESANKFFGTSICVSHNTAKRCHDIIFRPIGEFLLKGKSKPQLIMEPLYTKKISTTFLQQYHQAYSLIRKDKRKAITLFEELLIQAPYDYLLYFQLNQLKSNSKNKNDI